MAIASYSLPVCLLRLLAAILFAFGTWRFVDRFSLFDFTFAAELCGGLVFASFLLFSQKYEPLLIAVSLAASLVIAFKAARLPEAPPDPRTERDAILDRLHVGAARLRLTQLKSGAYPAELPSDLRLFPSADEDFFYCLKPCPWPVPKSESAFWLKFDAKNSRDKEGVLWYISDRFEIFTMVLPDGNFTRISAASIPRKL